ncbi:MAG: UDP binding domain-containing protein, partial [Myxococcota bacterium]
VVKLLRRHGHPIKDCRIGVLGLTFKENVPDLRNSRVPDIVEELRDYGIEPLVHDPLASAEEANQAYGIELRPWDTLCDLDGVVLAVPHEHYVGHIDHIAGLLRSGGLFVDVKSMVNPGQLRQDVNYWSL